MEQSMSRILVGTVVRQALQSIKESPERGIRNLVDMALQFSEGRFQKDFFCTAQTMLQNENSAYYGLVRDTVNYTDIERLYTFGMNLGYNGCTAGARQIRYNEKRLNCNIPWSIALQFDMETLEERQEAYDGLIRDGEELGIYVWMLFGAGGSDKVLQLVGNHPNSAFCMFCVADDLTEAVLEEAAELRNVMLVVRYEEHMADICAVLRTYELPYSVWYPYGEKDAEMIVSGDLFSSTQQESPVFTVLIPEKDCPNETSHLIYRTVKQMREEQAYRTIVWELRQDNCLVDSIISGDSCAVYFDKNGDLYNWSEQVKNRHDNMFRSSLKEILMNSFAK